MSAVLRPSPWVLDLSSPSPPAAPPARSARSGAELVELAQEGLRQARAAATPPERYAHAHLAALRTAAAVLAARARPASPPRSGRPASAWALLAAVAPELGEWAGFFAAGAGKRSAAEAGLPVVTRREADDLVRAAETFLELVAPAGRPPGGPSARSWLPRTTPAGG